MNCPEQEDVLTCGGMVDGDRETREREREREKERETGMESLRNGGSKYI